MKSLIIIFTMLLNQGDCDSIQTIRNEYHKINSEEKLESFTESLNKHNCDLKTPYQASAIMQYAEYTFWPTKKLKKFKQGKKMLETYIANNPNNIEARYIRVLVQSEIPKILGYSNNIESDIEYIKLKIDDANLPKNYKKRILQNISKIK